MKSREHKMELPCLPLKSEESKRSRETGRSERVQGLGRQGRSQRLSVCFGGAGGEGSAVEPSKEVDQDWESKRSREEHFHLSSAGAKPRLPEQ